MVGVLMLPDTVQRRLDSIRDLSRQGKRVNGLFRLMACPLLWEQAYAEIAPNKGALTRGATGNTLDGFSIERMQALIGRVMAGGYRFTPVRRVHIPKPNGKTRPLGIPTADDKLVQGVVKLLLELIYEPVFSRHSHGFRRGRSCQTALSTIQDTWTGVKWLVDVDVVGFFDNIDHGILLGLLRKRIDDERFIALVNGMLRAGYMEDWTFHATFSGTPQGGVANPPTILPKTVLARAGWIGCGECAIDAEHDIDVVLVDLDPLDQGADQVALHEPVDLAHAVADAFGEVLEPSDDE